MTVILKKCVFRSHYFNKSLCLVVKEVKSIFDSQLQNTKKLTPRFLFDYRIRLLKSEIWDTAKLDTYFKTFALNLDLNSSLLVVFSFKCQPWLHLLKLLIIMLQWLIILLKNNIVILLIKLKQIVKTLRNFFLK